MIPIRHSVFAAVAARGFVLLAVLGTTPRAMAQEAPGPYPAMAPVEQYLMDRTAEIALARSAAPEALSREATVLVLGREGYETAVAGSNGFVCMVGRAWGAAFDWAEFWNPKVRAADCMNPQAARSVLPITLLRARMVMAGRSRKEIVSAVRAAFETGELPDLESGAMSYMMSPSGYLTDQGAGAPHLMFYTLLEHGADWGSGAAGAPVLSSPYWFFSPGDESRVDGLPPILVFLVGVGSWSDGTAVGR